MDDAVEVGAESKQGEMGKKQEAICGCLANRFPGV